MLGEVDWPRRLGAVSCAWRLLAVAVVGARGARRRPPFAIGSSTRRGRTCQAAADRGDRDRQAAVGVSADGTILAWLPPPQAGTLPAAAALQAARRRAAGRHGARRGAGPRCRPGRSSPLPEEQLLRRKRGRRETASRGSNCASAMPRRRRASGEAAAAVLADPSVTALDYVDLNAPSRAGDRRLRALLPSSEPEAFCDACRGSGG